MQLYICRTLESMLLGVDGTQRTAHTNR